MKFLFLLLLITACGKQANLQKVDYEDPDGDGKSNYEERTSAKDLAELPRREHVEGQLSLVLRPGQFVAIPFSTKVDLNQQIKELLTANPNRLKLEAYFDEWNQLRLTPPKPFPTLPRKMEASLFFESTRNEEIEVILTEGSRVRSLGLLKRLIPLTLTSDEVDKLMTKAGTLSLRRTKAFEEKIRKSTYRVYFHDKVIYVSARVPFEDFLKREKIKDIVDIKDHDIIELGKFPEVPIWWFREVGDKDKILVLAKPSEVKAAFMAQFVSRKERLVRQDGIVNGSLVIEKKPWALLFVKIRGRRLIRTFKEESRTASYILWRGQFKPYSCTYTSRKVTAETWKPLTFEELTRMTIIRSAFYQFDLRGAIYQQQEGDAWTLGFIIDDEKIDIALTGALLEEKVVTGLFKQECTLSGKPREALSPLPLYPEGRAEITLETLVEKP